ncbi:hypothetical protein TNCV_3520561 [Trichonephila clavipes]|nr:hypothetical protein TNCV_3520561 [Trichonephila clavipes]
MSSPWILEASSNGADIGLMLMVCSVQDDHRPHLRRCLITVNRNSCHQICRSQLLRNVARCLVPITFHKQNDIPVHISFSTSL